MERNEGIGRGGKKSGVDLLLVLSGVLLAKSDEVTDFAGVIQ